MKKDDKSYIHATATNYEKIFVSAGKVGIQIELSPDDLITVAGCITADII